MKQRTLARWGLAGLLVVAGCSASQDPELIPGSRRSGTSDAPAYFSQSTDYGYRYAHNWVNRPCFTIDLPGHNWVLQSATPDFVMWNRGDHTLKVYLTDNRVSAFAVGGMDAEQALRAFIGFELDYIKPKFDRDFSPPPMINVASQGMYALWQWEGRGGRRAGVGRAQPADQRHTIISLWIDPFVLSFDWATANIAKPDTSIEVQEILESLDFYPECFASMRSGETWVAPASEQPIMEPPSPLPSTDDPGTTPPDLDPASPMPSTPPPSTYQSY
ncbi:MAG TPA: hypothetical protein VEL28_05295 [Candidatus Binatia bacterium]|nr:hypothetical protein [Candidatus Binatia bacterium]